MTDLYLLEVVEKFREGRGRYWRPKSMGYTDDPSRAGVYAGSHERVARALAEAADEDFPFEIRHRAVPIADVLPSLEAAADEAVRRLESFREMVKIAELEASCAA